MFSSRERNGIVTHAECDKEDAKPLHKGIR